VADPCRPTTLLNPSIVKPWRLSPFTHFELVTASGRDRRSTHDFSRIHPTDRAFYADQPGSTANLRPSVLHAQIAPYPLQKPASPEPLQADSDSPVNRPAPVSSCICCIYPVSRADLFRPLLRRQTRSTWPLKELLTLFCQIRE
jgi:hypothetical protein